MTILSHTYGGRLPTQQGAADAAADRYLTDRVMTASPAQLTQMLYDAAVGAVRAAVRLTGEGDHGAATPKLRKAQDIVLELRSTLNHEAAGELSASLDSVYTWVWQRLVHGSLHRDVAAMGEALASLTELSAAWRESCVDATALA